MLLEGEIGMENRLEDHGCDVETVDLRDLRDIGRSESNRSSIGQM